MREGLSKEDRVEGREVRGKLAKGSAESRTETATHATASLGHKKGDTTPTGTARWEILLGGRSHDHSKLSHLLRRGELYMGRHWLVTGNEAGSKNVFLVC